MCDPQVKVREFFHHLNKPHHPHPHPHHESSLSTSLNTSFTLSNFQFLTTTTTTTTSSLSSFNSKLGLSSHQHHFPCCFNVSSRQPNSNTINKDSFSSMATSPEFSFHTPFQLEKKKLSGQQRKEELEREVSMLQKKLRKEANMHQILERIDHPQPAAILIPNFLPSKTKELLMELAMVEEEISRLEGQIRQLEVGLKHEKESKFKERRDDRNASPLRSHFQDTKSLHYISKAIKGISHHKENHFHQDPAFQFKFPTKTGINKPPSPLRDPQHPSPKPGDHHREISLEHSPKSLSNSIQSEENSQNLQPNKLSESIMQCLILIFVRLLRTSRAMELEKSSPISRSMHSSLSSRSFRTAETSLNSKSNLTLQKESRQQDPYGIFNTEESIPRDIGHYKNLVRITSTSLDPKCISNSSSITLLTKLRTLMSNLQKVDLRFLTFQQKLAFWINMYNACIMHGFLQYGVPSTPEKLTSVMNKASLNIGGNIINAETIEHSILRKQASSNPKGVHQKREENDQDSSLNKLYLLESMNPNIIFALCCGTRSSPAVKIYTAEGVIAELDKSKLEYLQASIVVKNTKRIGLPELLVRNMSDFAQDRESLMEWVCHQLPTSGSLRRLIVECFRVHNTANTANITNVVDTLPCDTEFQYLLAS